MKLIVVKKTDERAEILYRNGPDCFIINGREYLWDDFYEKVRCYPPFIAWLGVIRGQRPKAIAIS